jgi:putative transposase
MTEDRLPLAELLAKAGDGDFLRSVAFISWYVTAG